jgi:hypothetical protein
LRWPSASLLAPAESGRHPERLKDRRSVARFVATRSGSSHPRRPETPLAHAAVICCGSLLLGRRRAFGFPRQTTPQCSPFFAVAIRSPGTSPESCVALFDRSLLSGLAWLAISVPFGRYVLPKLMQWAHRLYAVHPNLWLSLVFDWGMFPGPPVGPLFGALSPVIFDLPVTSLQGAILGLVVGPIVSAAEGFAVTLFFWLVFGLITRMRPDARRWPVLRKGRRLRWR